MTRLHELTEALVDANLTPREDELPATPARSAAIVADGEGLRVFIYPGDECSVDVHALDRHGATRWVARFDSSVPVTVVAAAIDAATRREGT